MNLEMIETLPPWEWPEDAGKTFLNLLKNRQADDSQRLLAAELAGDFTVVNNELAEALLSVLRSDDEPDELRAQAAISFGPALEAADEGTFDGDPEGETISDDTFTKIKRVLQGLYMDVDVPQEVRRRILEAAIRSPHDWHRPAISSAYANDDAGWKLTAVFCMRFINGFDKQILEALGSEDDEIHIEAVQAAGNQEVDGAWAHVVELVRSKDTDKLLLLAAIDAVANIRPEKAGEILDHLTSSDDEEIVEAASDAMHMAEAELAVERGDDDFF
jgi:uncharacterized protein (UPF0147 family)